MRSLSERMIWRRGRGADEGEAEVPGSRHLESPRLASIIRVTLSERSPLLMIQHATPITRTAMKTSAASAGMSSRTRRAAGSIPVSVRPAWFRALFMVPRPYDAETATRRSSRGSFGSGVGHTLAARRGQLRRGQDPTNRIGLLGIPGLMGSGQQAGGRGY